MVDQELVPRRLSHEEAREEQRRYWAGKSIAERLAGMTELTRRMNRMREVDGDEGQADKPADLTPRRVRRSQG